MVLTAREDAWVPLYRSEETAEALRGAGADVTVEIYEDKEHHINDAAIESIRSLLERVAETNGKHHSEREQNNDRCSKDRKR